MAPHAFIMEGYGITECSPVVAGNLPDKLKPGSVGPPVDGVEVCLVDPDSHQPLPAGTTGMLLVRGPSIFNGYLNYNGPDPFTEVDGKRWYVTGDLVRLDEDGYIYFCGRLKRFLKIGGEMVSLPALEEPLSLRLSADGGRPAGGGGGRRCPQPLDRALHDAGLSLKQANAILAEAGLRGVMRLDAVERIEAIPVLGTGKTDYKVLRKLVAERGASIIERDGRGRHETKSLHRNHDYQLFDFWRSPQLVMAANQNARESGGMTSGTVSTVYFGSRGSGGIRRRSRCCGTQARSHRRSAHFADHGRWPATGERANRQDAAADKCAGGRVAHCNRHPKRNGISSYLELPSHCERHFARRYDQNLRRRKSSITDYLYTRGID